MGQTLTNCEEEKSQEGGEEPSEELVLACVGDVLPLDVDGLRDLGSRDDCVFKQSDVVTLNLLALQLPPLARRRLERLDEKVFEFDHSEGHEGSLDPVLLL